MDEERVEKSVEKRNLQKQYHHLPDFASARPPPEGWYIASGGGGARGMKDID